MDAILIAGPTASGKSALAMRLARRHGGVIVNADSMQVYAPLSILSARPSREDMQAVEHRLYGHVSGETSYSTGAWYRDAEAVLAEIRCENRLPVIVGGTGLYFRALTGGLAEMPPIPEDIRAHWRKRLAEIGPVRLHAELAGVDFEAARSLETRDGQRIVRALEVFHATGSSITMLRGQGGVPLVRPDRAERILVLPERPALRARIAERAAAMMRSGAVEEVRALLGARLDASLPVMKAIGVREIGAFIDGRLDRAKAEEQFVNATRQYAKRQVTWFRNQLGPGWRVRETSEN